MINILAIPGSLRPNSSSNLILDAMVACAPNDCIIEVFDGVGGLPHFNDADVTPDSVREFKERIKTSDAVLICTPEYAFGIPGSLKNALDWTVASGEFVDKPVGLVTASSQGENGHAALLLVLRAISANVIDDATFLIPFVRSKLDPAGRVKDAALLARLRNAVEALAAGARGATK